MKISTILTLMVALLTAHSAAAYIGPGAGIGALGTAAALVGSILLLIVGFVWYPVKRLLRKRKTSESSAEEVPASPEEHAMTVDAEAQHRPETDR